jgi:hypothetical protein
VRKKTTALAAASVHLLGISACFVLFFTLSYRDLLWFGNDLHFSFSNLFVFGFFGGDGERRLAK